MARYKSMTRRDFVNLVLVFISTFIALIIGVPAIGYLLSPALKIQIQDAWIPAGPIDSYPIGVPTLFSYTRSTINGWEKTVNSYGAYVTRLTPESVRVFSNVCTHLGCRVTWKDDAQDYLCPCHDGHFDINGTVISGPPPKHLIEYETKVEDGTLYIHHMEG